MTVDDIKGMIWQKIYYCDSMADIHSLHNRTAKANEFKTAKLQLKALLTDIEFKEMAE